jgi:hypothetical protein
MRNLLLILVASTGFAFECRGQGHVIFDNVSPGLAPVTISTVPGTFNAADGPPGAYVGSNYTASLYFVNGTVTDQTIFDASNPIWVADTLFFGTTGTGPGHGFDGDGSGFFDGGTATLSGQTSFIVTFQVRSWYNGGGLFTSYAQSFAAGHNVGTSNLLPLPVSLPPGPAGPLTGLMPFTVGIPEPSPLLLAAFGGAALLLFRRRK